MLLVWLDWILLHSYKSLTTQEYQQHVILIYLLKEVLALLFQTLDIKKGNIDYYPSAWAHALSINNYPQPRDTVAACHVACRLLLESLPVSLMYVSDVIINKASVTLRCLVQKMSYFNSCRCEEKVFLLIFMSLILLSFCSIVFSWICHV